MHDKKKNIYVPFVFFTGRVSSVAANTETAMLIWF